MKQETFEQHYSDCWEEMETLLEAAENSSWLSIEKGRHDPRLPQLYRRICHHLSLAQERRYSSYLVDKLNDLVLRGHQQLYRRRSEFIHRLKQFLVYDFPVQVREQAGYLWLATAVFYGPILVLFALIQLQPEFIYSVLDHGTLSQFESMYDPEAKRVGRDRDAGSDTRMFGHYIQNNISIGFQTFASGLFAGLGSLFYLVYNGVFFGALASHVVNIGYQDTFYSFVIAHGSFELTAIVICGAAGFMLGHTVLAPGRRTRAEALKAIGPKALTLVYGGLLMLLLAAFVEAYWSSNSALSLTVKYSVGAALWALVLGYLWLSGRAAANAGRQR